MSTQDYTAEEAMAVLKMPRSTFFKEVEKGNVPSVLDPGRKRGRRYPKEAIDIYAILLHKQKRPPLDFSFSRATNADIWVAIENARRLYGDNDIIPYKKVLEWRFINDEMTMILKDHDIFAGSSTIMPIDEPVIKSLLKDEIRERDIPDKAIRRWTDLKLSAYIASVAIVSSGDEKKDTYRGWFLLQHTIKWTIALYHQYDIKKFYSIGVTATGQNILERMGFREINSLEGGKRKGYILEDISKPTRLMSRFLDELETQEPHTTAP